VLVELAEARAADAHYGDLGAEIERHGRVIVAAARGANRRARRRPLASGRRPVL
jgi:hypothetical protein